MGHRQKLTSYWGNGVSPIRGAGAGNSGLAGPWQAGLFKKDPLDLGGRARAGRSMQRRSVWVGAGKPTQKNPAMGQANPRPPHGNLMRHWGSISKGLPFLTGGFYKYCVKKGRQRFLSPRALFLLGEAGKQRVKKKGKL